jgi:glycosyltransferase involved in cell wall biosynthesis
LSGKVTRFSVLITCFNYRQYVEQAINSALAQSLAPSEIIVVDDGSTDGSAQFLKERFVPIEGIQIITTPNRGHLAAICEGFFRSTGDAIALLDADDTWEPSYLERVSEQLSKQESFWLERLRNDRRASIDPPRSGTGSGNIPGARRNRTGGHPSTRQPSGPIRTWLRRCHYHATGAAAGAAVIGSALDLLEARASEAPSEAAPCAAGFTSTVFTASASVVGVSSPSARVCCQSLSATGSGSMLSLCHHASSSPERWSSL